MGEIANNSLLRQVVRKYPQIFKKLFAMKIRVERSWTRRGTELIGDILCLMIMNKRRLEIILLHKDVNKE